MHVLSCMSTWNMPHSYLLAFWFGKNDNAEKILHFRILNSAKSTIQTKTTNPKNKLLILIPAASGPNRQLLMKAWRKAE